MSREKYANRIQGSGWFRYKNDTPFDMLLQKPLIGGRSLIKPGGIFEGDSFYRKTPGVRMIADLSGSIGINSNPQTPNHLEEEKKKQLAEASASTAQIVVEQKPELLVDTVITDIKFFESDGTEIQKEKISNREKGEIDITKKELVEYATLKGLSINKNWTKEKILEKVREINKKDPAVNESE